MKGKWILTRVRSFQAQAGVGLWQEEACCICELAQGGVKKAEKEVEQEESGELDRGMNTFL